MKRLILKMKRLILKLHDYLSDPRRFGFWDFDIHSWILKEVLYFVLVGVLFVFSVKIQQIQQRRELSGLLTKDLPAISSVYSREESFSSSKKKRSLDLCTLEIVRNKDWICFTITNGYGTQVFKSYLYKTSMTFTTHSGFLAMKSILWEIYFHLVFSNVVSTLQEISQDISLESILLPPDIITCQDKKQDSKNPVEEISAPIRDDRGRKVV